ncbi:MAG: hypothetical protein HQ594_06900 [Candidatus Omnitrophica bacterium]|nr:hypothetical protein [Candidatus Omnitrophota bacterium]
MDKLLKKYQPVMKKTGEQLSKAMKAAEEDIAKMYRIAQKHVEIQMKNLQKERLYHEIGKDVSDRIKKGTDISASSLEKYKKRLEKLDTEGDKIKKKLSSITKIGKKKKSSSKK